MTNKPEWRERIEHALKYGTDPRVRADDTRAALAEIDRLQNQWEDNETKRLLPNEREWALRQHERAKKAEAERDSFEGRLNLRRQERNAARVERDEAVAELKEARHEAEANRIVYQEEIDRLEAHAAEIVNYQEELVAMTVERDKLLEHLNWRKEKGCGDEGYD